MSIIYSIIIPHKNCPDLLQRCIDSIPEREDTEVIVVDDNSDPSKVDFLNFPGNTRKEVKLIFTKEGKGAGYARNVGMDAAQGKWLIFADADDVFVMETLNSEMDKQINSDADIIFFDVDWVNVDMGDTRRNWERKKMIKKGSKKAEDWLRYVSNQPWGKMLKRKFIVKNNIRFSEVIAGNDFFFSCQTGVYAKNVNIVPICIYNYLFRRNDCITANRSREAMFAKINEGIKRNIFLEKYNLSFWCDNEFKRNYLRLRKLNFSRKDAITFLMRGTPRKLLIPHMTFGFLYVMLKLVYDFIFNRKYAIGKQNL